MTPRPGTTPRPRSAAADTAAYARSVRAIAVPSMQAAIRANDTRALTLATHGDEGRGSRRHDGGQQRNGPRGRRITEADAMPARGHHHRAVLAVGAKDG